MTSPVTIFRYMWLPHVSGSCTRYITCWYFNRILRKCHLFIYSEYEGNNTKYLTNKLKTFTTLH